MSGLRRVVAYIKMKHGRVFAELEIVLSWRGEGVEEVGIWIDQSSLDKER